MARVREMPEIAIEAIPFSLHPCRHADEWTIEVANTSPNYAGKAVDKTAL
jgi:hypothetical protein